MPPGNSKRLFIKPPTRVTQPSRLVQPQMSYTKVYQSIYVDAPTEDGIITRYMTAKCRIVKAFIHVDSLKDDETALMRIERISGGEEYSFLIKAGDNAAALSIVCKDGDRLLLRVVVDPGVVVKGVWLSFMAEID